MPVSSSSFFSALATARVSCFSLMVEPMAPGSMPPWPGSMTISGLPRLGSSVGCLAALPPRAPVPAPAPLPRAGQGPGGRLGDRRDGGDRAIGDRVALELGAELGIGHRPQVDQQPQRLAIGGRNELRPGDLRRLHQVEHDPRGAGLEQAIAHAGDQALPLQLAAAGDLPVDLAHVDDDAIGIGQGEDLEIAALGQGDDHARQAGLHAQARVGDGRLGSCFRSSPEQHYQAKNPAN